MPNNEQNDFDEEFAKAVAEWRDKHRLAATRFDLPRGDEPFGAC